MGGIHAGITWRLPELPYTPRFTDCLVWGCKPSPDLDCACTGFDIAMLTSWVWLLVVVGS